DRPVDRHRFDPSRLPTVGDADPLTRSVPETCHAIASMVGSEPLVGTALRALLEHAQALYAHAGADVDPRNELGQRVGDAYARVFAGACVARAWHTSLSRGPEATEPVWLAAALLRILEPRFRIPEAVRERMFSQMMAQFSQDHMFSLF